MRGRLPRHLAQAGALLLHTGKLVFLHAPLQQRGHHAQGLKLAGHVVAQGRRHPPQQGVARRFFMQGIGHETAIKSSSEPASAPRASLS
jgi:hypothetical protein